jgi:hypothetical protein
MDETRYILAWHDRTHVVRKAAHGKRDEGRFWGIHTLGAVESFGQGFAPNVARFSEAEARALLADPEVNAPGAVRGRLVAFVAEPVPESKGWHRLGARAFLGDREPFEPPTLQQLLDAARAHGDQEGSETEAGDLMQMLQAAHDLLTPGQRARFLADIRDLRDVPEYEGIGL